MSRTCSRWECESCDLGFGGIEKRAEQTRYVVERSHAAEAEVERLRARVSDEPGECVMTHTPPFDFAQCETHDETFPLGGACRFHGRTSVAEVYADEADQMRARAVLAEAEVARLTAERDAAIERLERVIDQWRKTGRAVISEMNRADKAEAERDALAAQVARVESLAGQWERLAVTAINPDSREWLPRRLAATRDCRG